MAQTYKTRLKDAEDIVENYYQQLCEAKKFLPAHFEHELRQRWQKHESVSALGFKEFLLKLFEDDRYKHVALYFMANDGNTQPAEYKTRLEQSYSTDPKKPLEIGSDSYLEAERLYWEQLDLKIDE